MAFVPDQRVVQQLSSDGSHEPFGGGVRPGCAGWGVDHLDSLGGEDLVEAGDEHGGVVPDQESEPVEVDGHGQVAGGLGAPRAAEGSGDAGEVHAAGGVFDEEQDMDLAERDGVDDEGVTGDDPAGLGGEELGPGRPGSSRGGVDAVAFEDGPHRGRRQPVTETGEFAVNSAVSPRRVLPGEAHHQIARVPGRCGVVLVVAAGAPSGGRRGADARSAACRG